MVSHGASLSLETIHPEGWFWLLVFMFVCFYIRQSSKGSDHIHMSVPRVPLGPRGPCTGFAFIYPRVVGSYVLIVQVFLLRDSVTCASFCL